MRDVERRAPLRGDLGDDFGGHSGTAPLLRMHADNLWFGRTQRHLEEHRQLLRGAVVADIDHEFRTEAFESTRHYRGRGVRAQLPARRDVSPKLATYKVGDKTKNNLQGVKYDTMTSLLVKAIQEQQTIIDDLKSRIKTLEDA